MKRNMPARLKAQAESAKVRHRERTSVPPVKSVKRAGRWAPASPYAETDDWEALICEAFGTASQSTVTAFMQQLQRLVGEYHDGKRWRPDDYALTAALNVVASTQPRNEMEAALAAQMVAVHLLTMKASSQAMEEGYLSPLAAATVSRLARTSAQQAVALAKVQGKATQRIVVNYERHDHQHIHYHHHRADRGGGDFVGQPLGPSCETGVQYERRPALPCPNAERVALSEAGAEGPSPVPVARLRQGERSAEGGEERRMEDGRLDQRGCSAAEGGRPRLTALQGGRA